MNNIKLIVFKNNTPYELDIDSNESIEIEYSVKTLDIESRQTFFTKTFNLYGTNTNNSFFENNFIGNNSFINQKYDCKLYINGSLVINGVLNLKEINVDKFNNNIVYSVEIVNKFFDFIETFGDDLIVGNEDESKDIDFSYIEQFADYSRQQMIESWSGTSKTFPFVYTIKNLGYDLDYDFVSGRRYIQSGFVENNQLKQDSIGVFPDLYAKTLLDLIFKKADINVKSNFFESEVFEKLIILNGRDEIDNTNYFVTTEGPSTGQTFNNIVRTTVNSGEVLELGYNTDPISSLLIVDSAFIPTGYTTENYTFTIEGFSQYQGGGTLELWVQTYLASLDKWIDRQKFDINPGARVRSFNYTTNYDLTSIASSTLAVSNGLRFTVKYVTDPQYPTNTLQGFVDGVKLSVVSSRKSISGRNLIPRDVKIRDFLVAIFRMYNLLIWEDNGEIRIEPYKDFYNTSNILNLNENNLVDKTSYQLIPLVDEIPNNIKGDYLSGDDWKSKYFQEKYGVNYGNVKVSVGGSNSEKIIQMNQVLTQFEDISGLKIPILYDIDTENKKTTINPKLRFLYYNGLKQIYNFYISNYEYSATPITSMFLKLEDESETIKLGPVTTDPIDNQSTIFGLRSNNGLITKYYGDELSLYDTNEYKLTIKVNLKFDLNFSLNTLIYLNINGINRYYRIESITFSSDESVLTEMVLIPISYNNIKVNITNSQGVSGTSLPEDFIGDNDSNGINNTNGGIFNRTNGNYNSTNTSNFVEIIGNNNYVDNSSNNILINGNNNYIGTGSTSNFVLGVNNILPDNENGGIWIDGERLNPYKVIKILTSGETINLHSIPVEVVPRYDGYITDITEAYMSINYPTGVTPTAYGNVKIDLYYSGSSSTDNAMYFDNKLLDSTTYRIHKGVPSYDKPLKETSILALAENTLNQAGNGILKFEIYFRKLKK